MKKTQLITTFYALFVFVLIYRLLENIKNGYEKESWHITEFLINYQGGFVRRGLLGEALFHITQYINFSPYFLIIALSLSAYLLLVYIFTRAFIKNGYPLFILPFVFFLGNPIINDFWVRKDIIELLLFILILHFTTKKDKRFIVLINVLLVIGILIHESIAFFGLPILALILHYKNRTLYTFLAPSPTRNILSTLLQLMLPITTFASVVYFKGSPNIASRIWESWRDVKFPIEQEGYTIPPAAIDGISWTLAEGLSYLKITLKNFDFDIYAPFAWALIIIFIYFILISINDFNFNIYKYKPRLTIDRINVSGILIIQLLAVLPLFILGWDYGRWVFLWTSSAFATLLIIPKQILTGMLPPIIQTFASSINRQFDNYLSNSKAFLTLLCLVIGVPFYNWSILSYVDTLAPILILQFVSEIFYEGVVLVKGLVGLN